MSVSKAPKAQQPLSKGSRSTRQVPSKVQFLSTECFIEHPEAWFALFPPRGCTSTESEDEARALVHGPCGIAAELCGVTEGVQMLRTRPAQCIDVVCRTIRQRAGFCMPLNRLEHLCERHVPGAGNEVVWLLDLEALGARNVQLRGDFCSKLGI